MDYFNYFIIFISLALALTGGYLIFIAPRYASKPCDLDNVKAFIAGAKAYGLDMQAHETLDGKPVEEDHDVIRNRCYGWNVSLTMHSLGRPVYKERQYITILHPVTGIPLVSFKWIKTVPREVKRIEAPTGHRYPVKFTDTAVPFVSVILVL